MSSGRERRRTPPRRHAQPRDWAWRRRIRQNPQTRRAYRVAVGALGAAVVMTGLTLVPLPGPGWLIVFLGVAILASEFHWAHRMHVWGVARWDEWQDWILASPWWVRGAVATATALFVAAVVWVALKLTGLPGWTPAWAASFLWTYVRL